MLEQLKGQNIGPNGFNITTEPNKRQQARGFN